MGAVEMRLADTQMHLIQAVLADNLGEKGLLIGDTEASGPSLDRPSDSRVSLTYEVTRFSYYGISRTLPSMGSTYIFFLYYGTRVHFISRLSSVFEREQCWGGMA